MPSLNGSIAKRYAEALLELALAKGEVVADKWEDDLRVFADAIENTPLLQFLENPKVHFADKRATLIRAFGGAVDMEPLNLFSLLIERDRPGLLRGVLDAYSALLMERKGIAIAEVTTAVPLPDSRQRELATRIGALLGKTIELRTKVDPSIIGGLVVRIGDRLLDGSVATRLSRLRSSLE
ncbi:MAG: ATP synthase F1 subunit delta [Chloroflexi bacterium]|nr:ATP synthase F1 subunit delta [Chloroflexota bacterium]